MEIPPGIQDGDSKVIHGAGNRPSRRSEPGDLTVTVRVAQHPEFSRDGDDVTSQIDLDYLTAMRGGSIEVKTLHGPQQLAVPAGTAHRSKLKLRGLGVPHRYRRGSGDHVFEVKLRVPTELTAKARQLMEQLREELGDSAPEPESTWQRFKDWFFG